MVINKSWDVVLESEMKQDYFKKLGEFVKCEYKNNTCYPQYNNIFNALRYTTTYFILSHLSYLTSSNITSFFNFNIA